MTKSEVSCAFGYIYWEKFLLGNFIFCAVSILQNQIGRPEEVSFYHRESPDTIGELTGLTNERIIGDLST